MVNNYTLKTQIEFIALEELEFELELERLNQIKEEKEPPTECLNSILQFASAFNSHRSDFIKDVNYLAN